LRQPFGEARGETMKNQPFHREDQAMDQNISRVEKRRPWGYHSLLYDV